MVQWLVLAARWWNTVLGKSQGCLALKALKDDVSLMLNHKQCWSRQFFDAMSTIKVIEKGKWHPRKGDHCKEDNLNNIRFDEERVRVCAERWFDRTWEACSSDPSMASEEDVFRSTYKHWVGYVDGQCATHFRRCIPQHVRREMVKLKLGCSELNVHRLRFEKVPREKRWCPLCCGQQVHAGEQREVEDLVHFVLHCGPLRLPHLKFLFVFVCYATIRAEYSTLFQSAHCHGEDDAQMLQYLFKQDNQLEFAYCIREMMEHRRKQVAEGRGAPIEGEVLAKLWDEKVVDIFDKEFEEVAVEGACEPCPVTLPEHLDP